MRDFMKKLISSLYIFLLLTTSIFLFGCKNINSPTGINDNNSNTTTKENVAVNNSDSQYKISDFYPFKENLKYTYEGTGNEYAGFITFVDFIKDNKIQIRKINGGTEFVSVLENTNGELKVLFAKPECYYRENFLDKASNTKEILLKEPLIKGTSWTLSDGRKRFISNTDVKVSTPLGEYKAIEVTTEEKDSITIDYYGLNMGLIKTVYKGKDMEVTSSISKSETSSFVQNIKFYYPNIDDDKLYYVNKEVSFKTNDISKSIIEKYLKESPNKELGNLIGAGVKINSLYLNDDSMVYIDFSKSFLTEMNAGSGYESMLLQCITNTLGNYYNADKVYITIENAPYSSGHIEMKKGEYFKVNYDNSAELKIK